MAKYLIVNADDFGLSTGVNRGIIQCTEQGILTSASLMVRQPAAEAAANYARSVGRLSIGLHLDLGEWVYKEDEWVPLYSVVAPDDGAAVAAEVSRQLAEFERLMVRPPTHIDSHQHVHRSEPVRSIVAEHAHRLGVPVRDQVPGLRYCGDFYGQMANGEPMPDSLSVTALKSILASLPEGFTELGCHPGYDDGLRTVYRTERAQEVATLCSPEVRQVLAQLDIILCAFGDAMWTRAVSANLIRPHVAPNAG